MTTETPTDWRRLFSGHAGEADAYRIAVSGGHRGSFVSPEPDVSLALVKLGEQPALRCSEHGTLIPSDMADAVHDQAVAVARAFAERKGIARVRYRVELLREGETLGRSTNRMAPLDPDSSPEDDEAPEQTASDLRKLALLRHADRANERLYKLNLEQAERFVALAETHGNAVASYNETLLGMVHTIAEERELADRGGQLDPEVAREGIELLRSFMMMQAAKQGPKEDARPQAESRGPASQVEIVRSVLDSLTPEEHDQLRELAGEEHAKLVQLAGFFRVELARELQAGLVKKARGLMASLSPELLAKLRPLGSLTIDA